MEVQVLMVDDHPPIIEGYRSILAYNSFGYILNTTAAHSCEAAYNAIFQANRPFDIVFLDLTLPLYSEKNINTGADLIPIVRKQHPNAKIVILTSHSESIVLYEIIKEHKLEGDTRLALATLWFQACIRFAFRGCSGPRRDVCCRPVKVGMSVLEGPR